MSIRSRAELSSVLFIIVLAALPALLIYPLPTQDGPQHAFTAYAFTRLGDVDLGFGRYLDAHFPLSSQGFVFLTIGLDYLLPFPMAERLALAIMLALFPLCGAIYAGRTGRSMAGTAGIMALTAHGWVLVMGFLNFLFAFALIPLAVSYFHRRLPSTSDEETGRRPLDILRANPLRVNLLPVAVVLLAIAWFHLVAAVFTGLVLVLTAFGNGGRDRWRLSVRVGVMGLPAAFYAYFSSRQHLETNLNVGFVTDVEAHFVPWADRLTELFWVGPGGISWITGVTGLVLVGVICVQATRTWRSWSPFHLYTLLGLFCLIAYCFAPLHAARWAYMAPRLLFCAMFALGLGSFPKPRSGKWTVAIVVVVAIGLIASGLALRTLHRQLEPINSAVSRLPHRAGSTILPLELDSEPIPDAPIYSELTQHIGLRALFGQGGILPYVFAYNRAVHSIVFVDDPVNLVGPAPGVFVRRGFACGEWEPARCLAHQQGLSDRIAYYGTVWRELLLFHPPFVLSERLRRRGFRQAFVDGEVALWAARPSSLELSIHVPEVPLPANLIIRVGMTGSIGWVDGLLVPVGATLTRPIDATLGPFPAGPLDFEAFLDSNGNGEREEGEWWWQPDELRLRPDAVVRLEHRVPDWN